MRTRFVAFFILLAVFAACSLDAGQIKGKVVDPAGKKAVKGIFAIASLQGENEDSEGSSRITAVTGDDGTFTLYVPDNGKGYEIIITDKEKNGFIYEGFSHISKTEDLGVIELARGCTLSGKVSDEKNNPVAGATVKADIRLMKYTCTHHAKAAETKTSADGSFEFADLAPREYSISVDSSNLFCEPAPIALTGDLNYIEFKMKPGCDVSGKTIAQDGKPVSGIEVFINGKKSVSGADGSFKVSGLPVGEQHISISSREYVLMSEDNAKVTCVSGKTAECTLTVVLGGKLSVLVSSSKPGIGLPENISVTFRLEGKKSYMNTTTKSEKLVDGKATFDAIRPGSYKIDMKGNKNLPKVSSTAVIESGKCSEIKVETVESYTITGKVLDENSKPVKGVGVRLTPAGGKKKQFEDFGSYDYNSTNDSGVFIYENLLPGKYELTAEQDGWMKAKVQAEAGPASKDEIIIKLDKGLSISGQVLEADGSPVPDLTVNINGKGTDDTDYIYKNGKTDSSGSFSISGFPEGKFDLKISEEQFSMDNVSTMNGVKAGSDGLIVTLAPKHKISFVAVDEEGKPVPDAEVSHLRAEYANINFNINRDDKDVIRSDKDGKFAVELRQGQKYVVSASKPPLLPGKKTIDLTVKKDLTEPVSLVLMKGMSLSGKTVDPSGKPLKDLIVRTSMPVTNIFVPDGMDDADMPDLGAAGKQSTTDDQGVFKIEGLAPGIITIYATSSGSHKILLAEKKLELKKDGPADIKFEIPETVKIKGTVIDSMGNPASEGVLNILNMEKPTISIKMTFGQGKFEIPMVPAGKYSFGWYVKKDGKVSSGTREVQVKAGMAELVLGGKADESKSTKVKGAITRDGKAVAADITFVPAPAEDAVPSLKTISEIGAKSKQTTSDETGSFEIEGLVPGKYIFSALSEEATASGRIEIKDLGQKLELKITAGSLKGSISAADGKAAAEASISLVPSICNFDTFFLAAGGETGKDGSYSIMNINPGKYDLVVWHDTGMSFVNGVEIGAKENSLDIKIEKGYKISGKVVLDSGKPADGAQVLVLNENDMPIANATVNPEDGSYSLNVLLPKGKYRLFSIMKEYSLEAAELAVSSDAKFDATLFKAGSARLKIRNPGIRTDKISIRTHDGKTVMRLGKFSPGYRLLCDFGIAIGDSSGDAILTGLRPGNYAISWGETGKEAKFAVKELEETAVEIR